MKQQRCHLLNKNEINDHSYFEECILSPRLSSSNFPAPFILFLAISRSTSE
jgi:hypothetical protein